MQRNRLAVLFAGVVVSVLSCAIVTTPNPARAQEPPEPLATPCYYVHIRDDSTVLDVDLTRTCEAAKPFLEQGVETYLWLTDEMYGDQGSWFNRLDQIEMAFKIRRPGNSFSDTAFSIAVSSDTSQPWGANTTLGKLLQRTPLERNGNIERLQAILKGSIRDDPTAAVVRFLTSSYDVAYLQQIHAQETKVSARATELFLNPPPTPLPPKTAAQIRAESEAQQRMLKSLFGYILAGLILFLIALLVRRLYKYLTEWVRLEAQARLLHKRIGDILLKAFALIDDETEGDRLYAVWESMGGSLQPQDTQVRQYLNEARGAGRKAIELWKGLEEESFPLGLKAARQLVLDLEDTYLTMVGRMPEVLNLTGIQQWDLMDVTTVVGDGIDGRLADQINRILARRDADSLQIAMMFAKPADYDEHGMMGYFLLVKQAIGQLQALREQLPDDQAELRAKRDEFFAARSSMYDLITVADQMTYIDAQLELAVQLMVQHRWTEADQALDRMHDALNRAPALLDELRKVFGRFDGRMTEFRRIDSSGYDLTIPECDKLREECVDDVSKLVTALKAGDWSTVEELTHELDADSKRMLEAAQALVALHDSNEAELRRLAEEVARVQAYSVEVDRMWTGLHRYPPVNFSDLDGNLGHANETLRVLFDNPSDADDLASEIATMNSLEVQNFRQAEQALLQAFSDLHEAELLLQAIQARLEQVQAIEQSIAQQIAEATVAHEKAFARRDLDNVLIDGVVDDQIERARVLIGEATEAAEKRQFTVSATKIAEARNLADLAYTSADEQATHIKGLRAELERSRTAAIDAVGQVHSQREEITLPARTSQTDKLIEKAQQALDAAKKVELAITGEDRELESSLVRAIQAYRAANTAGREAIQSLEADDRTYRQLLSEVGGEIDAASRAISDADRYVRDSDAHRSGSGSLDKARTALPDKPAYGATMEDVRAARANAKIAADNAAQAESSARSRIRQEEQERAEEERRQERARQAALAASRASYHSSSSSGYRSSGFSSGFRSGGFSSGSRH